MKRGLITLTLMMAIVSFSFGQIYLQLSGDNLVGESFDANHKGWIDVLNFDFSMDKSFDMRSARSQSNTEFSTITINKHTDKASPGLMLNLAKGTVLKNAVIDITKRGSKGNMTYLKYELSGVVVTSYSVNSEPGGLAEETITLAFKQIMVTYPGSKTPFKWDVVSGN